MLESNVIISVSQANAFKGFAHEVRTMLTIVTTYNSLRGSWPVGLTVVSSWHEAALRMRAHNTPISPVDTQFINSDLGKAFA